MVPKTTKQQGVGGGDKPCLSCFQPTGPETYQSTLMFCFQILSSSNSKVGLNHKQTYKYHAIQGCRIDVNLVCILLHLSLHSYSTP